jgi:hypothetical protein
VWVVYGLIVFGQEERAAETEDQRMARTQDQRMART